jgi:hypothetical protein
VIHGLTLTEWLSIILGAIIIVGIVAIARLKSIRHRGMAEQRADIHEQALRHLSPDDRQHFGRKWRLIEARFIEDPRNAVAEADRVVEQLLSARGYPVQKLKAGDTAVAHSEAVASGEASRAPVIVQSYREAHEIALKQTRGAARGNELRRAMIDYRIVFEDLVGDERSEQQESDAAHARSAG